MIDFKDLSDEELLKLHDEKKNEVEYYDLKQYTEKIKINSVYGAVGSRWFSMANKHIAHAITSYGRHTIKVTGDICVKVLNNKFNTDTVKRVLTDTDSFYLTLDGIIQNKKLKERKEVSEYINNIDVKIIQPVIRKVSHKMFNDFNGFKDCIYFDREKICHLIVSGKKKYAVDLLDEEGKFYDKQKVKITGLETKRSDTPSIIRKKLDNFLGLLFDDDNVILIDFMEEFEKEYFSKTLGVDEISSPTGISNITKYEGKKSMPIHVRASMNFNKFLEQNEDKLIGMNRINNGDKIKWFYVKANPFIRDNVFAYNDRSIFKEFPIHEYINYDLMFSKTFTKKAKDLGQKVGMNITMNESLMDDLF